MTNSFRGLLAASTALTLVTGPAMAQEMMSQGMTGTGNAVVFPEITMTAPGYVVIHEVDADGNPVVPASIGHAALAAGSNTNVTVPIPGGVDPDAVYAAMLHDETNGNATYDFGEGMTDVDTPTLVGGNPVVTTFGGIATMETMDTESIVEDAAETVVDDAGDVVEDVGDAADAVVDTATDAADALLAPLIAVAGAVFDGSSVTFPSVMAAQDGYLVLHETDASGAPVVPASIGHAAVDAGENTNVVVTTDMDLAPGTYVAMLHVEDNGNDSYDFGEGMTDVDVPAMADGAPVTASFTIE